MEFNVFESIKIGLASPEQIRSWSYGEVTKPETINYRTLKPERDGLYCERIFGPTKDWECHCGKYKRIRFKGKVCERCGVEVTRSKVRRERMGHIELAAPVSHIWYFKGIPSRMGLILDLSPRVLEKVLYFALYIVTDPGSVRELSKMQTLTEKEYRDMREKYEDDFEASMGAEAVKKLLEDIDCEKLSEELKKDLETAQGQKRVHILKRLEVVESFRISGNRGTQARPPQEYHLKLLRAFNEAETAMRGSRELLSGDRGVLYRQGKECILWCFREFRAGLPGGVRIAELAGGARREGDRLDCSARSVLRLTAEQPGELAAALRHSGAAQPVLS